MEIFIGALLIIVIVLLATELVLLLRKKSENQSADYKKMEEKCKEFVRVI